MCCPHFFKMPNASNTLRQAPFLQIRACVCWVNYTKLSRISATKLNIQVINNHVLPLCSYTVNTSDDSSQIILCGNLFVLYDHGQQTSPNILL